VIRPGEHPKTPRYLEHSLSPTSSYPAFRSPIQSSCLPAGFRLNNTSQLSGFAKRDDLAYFLKALLGVSYTHELLLAPTQIMLDEYQKNKGSWEAYELHFRRLMEEREVERTLSPKSL
jgi:hypothetical protein